MATVNTSRFYVLIHESLETLVEDFKIHPSFTTQIKDKTHVIVTKVKIKNISTNKKPCMDNESDLASICARKKAQILFEKQYGCILPWMKSKQHSICPIVNETRMAYKNLLFEWETLVKKQNCEKSQPCQRSLYQLQFADLHDPYFNPATNGAVLQIQLGGPNIMHIEDFLSYDFQSLIGEVGGTLGLFLGLSFLSIIQCIEYITKNLQRF